MNNEIILPLKYRNLERTGRYKYQIKSKFLVFPKKIDNKIKWLCNSIWIEESSVIYKFNWLNFIGGPVKCWTDWKPIEWL